MERGEGPLVAVLGGLPGVGKSALGKQWMHLVRERFDGGDLVADFSKRRRGPGVDVSGVLADFIRRLSPVGAIIPATLEERTERFRALTFDRKLLVLLDDVTEAAEVSQLQPLGKGCLLVATSYREFQELHYEGAEYVPVDPLTPGQAKEMLVTLAGERGAEFERDEMETAKLLAYCGGLALPLCVCASRLLLGGGGLSVAAIAATVADEQRRPSTSPVSGNTRARPSSALHTPICPPARNSPTGGLVFTPGLTSPLSTQRCSLASARSRRGSRWRRWRAPIC